MNRTLISAGVGALLLAWAAPAQAQMPTSKAAVQELDRDLVLPLLHCSIAAYQEKKITDYKPLKQFRIELVAEPLEHKEYEVRGFMARRENNLIVAFRGTVLTEIANWYANTDAILDPVEEDGNLKV